MRQAPLFRTERAATPWRPWAESFIRHIRAENASEFTIEAYGEAIRQFADFLGGEPAPTPERVTRAQVEDFITDQLKANSSATAALRHKGLTRLYAWAIEEGEVGESPVARVVALRLAGGIPDAGGHL